ncbi:protein kinase [Streptomyces sp. NBC_01275]|uniref:protein kinase domain-containing protein n=1 Tax=Streptomyces sp. NBC_01275 TaxID=2903807 RepID=UPI002255CB53|nr:LamG-like jellyroll fold domain-containing protein [Streptomyces sp. NBC_01275]MCX4764167.1 protein kinase [Streptomyces sp. NBC_01275]
MSALEPDDPRSVGEYRLLSRLGAGGMGQVYLGRSPGGRLVAVKVVHSELLRRPEFRSRFRREVQAARSVSGAFTAPVIDADPDADQPWLVTSYIAGPSLEQAVAERGPFAPAEVLALAAGLAEALVSIHSVNLVHRDLKPSNVLLAEDGPRVIDFGIVRSLESDSLTATGLLAGSPGFMSPEQVAGGAITPASDVFCLGAVLAFAATGRNPFGAGPTPALLYRVVHDEPDVDAIADPALRSLVSACLVKDPGGRPTPRQILTHVGPVAGALQTPGASVPAAAHAPTRAGAAEIRDYPRTQVLPTHAATQLDTAARPPLPQQPGPYGTEGPGGLHDPYGPYDPTVPGDPGSRGRSPGRSRRGFLLAGAVTVLGVGAGVWLTRDDGAKSGADASPSSSSPSPAASAVSVPGPVGLWPLDEASGDVARDTLGGNDGTATGVQWHDGAAVFDGTSSQIVTAGPVVDTSEGRSFSVSAWVRLTAIPGTFATAVSQEGEANSCFYLQYSGDERQWVFAGAGQRAVARTAPAAGVWTHLVGVCDGPGRRLRVYVDGVQEGTVADTTAAGGSLVIGRAKYNGGPADFFPGAVRDVRVFDQALTTAQVKTLK